MDAHHFEETTGDRQRGHKLLKDKRDELMKGFLELARENKVLREQVEEALADVYGSFSIAGAVMSKEVMEEALMFPKQGVALTIGSKNVMSVDVPRFGFETTAADASDIYPYGYASTSGELDSAIKDLADIFPIMLELAAKEKEAQMLARSWSGRVGVSTRWNMSRSRRWK